MNREIFAIIDTVAKDISGQLIVVRNENEAIRWFGDLLLRPDTTVGAHPKDHRLESVGVLIVDQGQLELVPTPRLIMEGARLHHILTEEQNRA